MTKRIWALMAATAVGFIYGINHTLAKDLMPEYIGPFGVILLRVLGAAIMFWVASLFVKSQPIQRKDWPRIFYVCFLGWSLICYSFLRG